MHPDWHALGTLSSGFTGLGADRLNLDCCWVWASAVDSTWETKLKTGKVMGSANSRSGAGEAACWGARASCGSQESFAAKASWDDPLLLGKPPDQLDAPSCSHITLPGGQRCPSSMRLHPGSRGCSSAPSYRHPSLHHTMPSG